MSKRFYLLFPILFIFADLSVVVGSYAAISYFMDDATSWQNKYLEALLVSLLGWLLVSILLFKDYKIGRPIGYDQAIWKSLRSLALFLALLSFYFILNDLNALSKYFLLNYGGLLLVLTPLERLSVHLLVNKYRKWGGNYRNSIIIGYDQLGFSLYNAINRNKDYGIRCDGFYGNTNQVNVDYPHLGNFDNFLTANIDHIDFIYVSDNVSKEHFNKIIEIADLDFKKVKLLPDFKTDFLKFYSLRLIDNINIVDVNNFPLDSLANRFLKRSFDLLFSISVLLFIMSWLYPIIALIIMLESKGQIIFKQMRNGKSNHPFLCFKFRTMYLNDHADEKWASKNDDRITPFGAFLRRTSLDELPQLFNVIRSEMTIVGPRPLPIRLNNKYKSQIKNYSQRHSFKPGITGLAQALGHRGEIRELRQIRNRVTLDKFYLNHWTLLLDVKIIAITFVELAKGQESAY